MTESNGNGKYNGNGHNDDDENVVRMPTLAERDKMRREAEKEVRAQYRRDHPSEPLINLPPVTKLMILLFFGIHLAAEFLLTPYQQYWLISHFGFIPGYFTGTEPFTAFALFGPVTYMFLHGSWMHVILNTVMLMAFGSGVERWIGGKKLLIFFTVCSITAALIHFIVNPFSTNPVVGASGGLSGLFAAVLIMLQQMGRLPPGRYGILPFVLLWIGISVAFGLFGGPGGSSIAWVAHIGGFLAGFVLLKPVMRLKI